MSKKLSLSGHSRKTIEEVFNDFVVSQTAQGLYDTLKNAAIGHWDKIVLDKSRASPRDCCLPPARRWQLLNFIKASSSANKRRMDSKG